VRCCPCQRSTDPTQVGPAGGLIGRSRKCTISLLHDCEVSHNHALLELYHGHLCIRDVGSTFGTYLNDKRLSEPKRASEAHKLKACDAIKVGQTSLRWRPLPVIRASLAVTVPASVRLLAEQCAALAEHAVALSPVDLRRDPGTPALAQRALGWPGVAGLPPTATGPASSAAGAASPAAAAAAAALEDFSRRSLSPVPNDTGGGSAHPTLDSNPDLGSPPFLGSAPILGSSSNLFSAPSLGFHPNLGSNVSFDTLPAPGAMASPPAHAGATGVAGAAGGEDRGSGTGAEGSGVGPGSRGGGVGGGAGDAGGSGAGAAASGAGGGSGGGGLELFHRAGANETHQRLLLALRTLYLRVRPASPRCVLEIRLRRCTPFPTPFPACLPPHPHLKPEFCHRVTHPAGSVPKFVTQKPDSVKVRSKCTADRKSVPRTDQIDEFQRGVQDHWRVG
jgi:hypothetical protein